jgi:hypothetical protein
LFWDITTQDPMFLVLYSELFAYIYVNESIRITIKVMFLNYNDVTSQTQLRGT